MSEITPPDSEPIGLTVTDENNKMSRELHEKISKAWADLADYEERMNKTYSVEIAVSELMKLVLSNEEILLSNLQAKYTIQGVANPDSAANAIMQELIYSLFKQLPIISESIAQSAHAALIRTKSNIESIQLAQKHTDISGLLQTITPEGASKN